LDLGPTGRRGGRVSPRHAGLHAALPSCAVMKPIRDARSLDVERTRPHSVAVVRPREPRPPPVAGHRPAARLGLRGVVGWLLERGVHRVVDDVDARHQRARLTSRSELRTPLGGPRARSPRNSAPERGLTGKGPRRTGGPDQTATRYHAMRSTVRDGRSRAGFHQRPHGRVAGPGVCDHRRCTKTPRPVRGTS
jgi:hypothetical protein